MRVLLIGNHSLSNRRELFATDDSDPLGEDLLKFRPASFVAFDGPDVGLERESVTIETHLREVAHDVGYESTSNRPFAVNDDEQVDVTLSVGLTTGDTAEDGDTDEVMNILARVEFVPNALDERLY